MATTRTTTCNHYNFFFYDIAVCVDGTFHKYVFSFEPVKTLVRLTKYFVKLLGYGNYTNNDLQSL